VQRALEGLGAQVVRVDEGFGAAADTDSETRSHRLPRRSCNHVSRTSQLASLMGKLPPNQREEMARLQGTLERSRPRGTPGREWSRFGSTGKLEVLRVPLSEPRPCA